MREITADCGSVPVIGIRHENGRMVAIAECEEK